MVHTDPPVGCDVHELMMELSEYLDGPWSYKGISSAVIRPYEE